MDDILVAPHLYTDHGFSSSAVPKGFRMLDVGCGGTKLPGAVGMDMLALPGVDVVHDMDHTPWPFADQSFDLVFLNHVLEHTSDVIQMMAEVHRVLAEGGRVVVQVPYFRCVDAYTDPTHRHFFTSRSLDYLIEGTALSRYAYSNRLFIKKGFWLGHLGQPRNSLRRALKQFIHAKQDFYDWYFSRLMPVRMVTWELEKIS